MMPLQRQAFTDGHRLNLRARENPVQAASPQFAQANGSFGESIWWGLGKPIDAAGFSRTLAAWRKRLLAK
jgi:hypothetical protein